MSGCEPAQSLQKMMSPRAPRLLYAESDELSTTMPNTSGLWAKLPNEIAIIIWELAFHANPPRLVHVALPEIETERGEKGVAHHRSAGVSQPSLSRQKRTWTQASSSVPPSPVTAVCKQSRYVALRATGQDTEKSITTKPIIWFSPEIDTLFLDENAVRGLWAKTKPDSLVGVTLRQVRKLAIFKPRHLGVSDFSQFDPTPRKSSKHWIEFLLRMWFRNLESITLVRQFFNPVDVKNLVLSDYYDIEFFLDIFRRWSATTENKEQVRAMIVSARARDYREMDELLDFMENQGVKETSTVPEIMYHYNIMTTPEKRDKFNETRSAWFASHPRRNVGGLRPAIKE
ncbi:uncharacterized protein RCO7_08940 [Rhynchosporium graminicola]|uniref:2EXR domain-containing protein n=1 Tax=Rhynchosporium graminicola TaxID=2792576 RepID=A0A1E1KJQ4_9HELO|nr:uncharacterized protein RCO7_08940 [Rhynchosporium commune]